MRHLFFLFIIALSNTAYSESWEVSDSKDEMTGEVKHFATSPFAKPKKKMGFPYQDVQGWIGVGCDKNSKWGYFGFNKAPNLNDTITEDGYSVIYTRVKWTDTVDRERLHQQWSSNILHAFHKENFIGRMRVNNSVLLELDWHGEGLTYFDFSLKGSKAAIDQIMSKCGH